MPKLRFMFLGASVRAHDEGVSSSVVQERKRRAWHTYKIIPMALAGDHQDREVSALEGVRSATIS